MKRLALIIIVCGAFFLRVYDLNWDSGQHLHPDERFLTMVTVAESFPSSLRQYLSPSLSTMNPYNVGFDFFVYGALPLTIVKSVAVAAARDNYFDITLIGRLLSALCDTVSVLMVYKLARRLFSNNLDNNRAYYAAAFYGVTVFAIQQGHFFTVDSFAGLFSLTAIYAAFSFRQNKLLINVFIAAIFFAAALACKVSTVLILPLILGAFFFGAEPSILKKLKQGSIWGGIFLIVTYMTLRVTDPKFFESASFLSFQINSHFIQNIKELAAVSRPETVYPPSVQWLSTTPILTPLKDIIFFGLGPVYAGLAIWGIFLSLKTISDSKKNLMSSIDILLILIWMVVFFVYQGVQFGKTMRYFYPLYPFLALFAAVGLSRALQWKQWAVAVVIIGIVLWPLAFMSIYTRPHSRVTASEYIYNNLPDQSELATEHWDDGLPLPIETKMRKQFIVQQLPVFAPDEQEKWRQMKQILSQADYYILSSNRGYGSILKVPKRYPQMSQFYKDLFVGKTDFKLEEEFVSYPKLCLPFTNFCYVVADQWADEAFTVYDHPRVLIFKKTPR